MKKEKIRDGVLPSDAVRMGDIGHLILGEPLRLVLSNRPSPLSVPVHGIVRITIAYDADEWVIDKGAPISAYLNGNKILDLEYTNEGGKKSVSLDITHVIKPGKNALRCTAIVLDQFGPPTKAMLMVDSDGSTALVKTFSTAQLYESIDQTWTLDYSKR